MAGDHGLSDLRFPGYDIGQLKQQVEGLHNGAGPDTLNEAVVALVKLANGLADTDEALRRQLADIGVTWQGEAADGGTSATETASIYADQSQGPTKDSAEGVDSQSIAYFSTKNTAPESGSLNGPTEQNGFDQFMGFFGHTTDHAQQVKDTNAAKQQAIDAMNNYQSNSIDSLGRSTTLPVPPGMSLNAQGVDTSTHSSSVSASSPLGFNPAGSGAGPGGGANNAFLPGGGGSVNQVPTTGNPLTGTPPITGTGPFPGGSPIPSTVNPLAPALRAANPLLMADAATALGAGSASGAGAGAERERLSRTGARGAGANALKNGTPLGAASEEEARAARNAERFGAKAGKPGSSIMQPAAAGRKGEGEDDDEHVRRYGVESSDVFDDERIVAPESIGDDDDQ
jgi:hypothetical protein